MKLRAKTISVIGITMTAMVLVILIFSSMIIKDGYDRIESQNMDETMNEINTAVSYEEWQIDHTVLDWAEWDDTYQYVVDHNSNYVSSNFANSSFVSTHMNMIAILDANGTLVYVEFFDLNAAAPTSVPNGFWSQISNDNVLVAGSDGNDNVSGIIMIDGQPMLVASREILTSESEGPSRGHLIMGRYLDENELNALNKITDEHFAFYPISDPIVSTYLDSSQMSDLLAGNTVKEAVNDSVMLGFSIVWTIDGSPSLIIVAHSDRAVYNQGQSTMRFLVEAMIVTCFMFIFISVLVIELFITSRVRRLDDDVVRIGKGGGDRRLAITGKDELSRLSISINGMIDNLRAAEEEVLQSERRYRSVVEDQTDLIFRVDPTMKLTFVNEQFCRYFGTSRDQAIGMGIMKFVEESDRPLFLAAALSTKTEAATMDLHAIDPSGNIRTHRWTFRGLIDDTGMAQEVQIVGKDVTESVLIEEELRSHRENLEGLVEQRTDELKKINERLEQEVLRSTSLERKASESEEKYRELIDNQGEGIAFIDLKGVISFANPAAEEMFSVPKGTLNGMSVSVFIDENTRKELIANFVNKRPQERTTFKLRLTGKGQVNRTLLVTGTPRQATDGSYLGIFAIFRDITANEAIEDALRKREAEYRSVVEDQTDFIVRTAPDETINLANSAFSRFIGIPLSSLVGMKFNLEMSGDSAAIFNSKRKGLSSQNPVAMCDIDVISHEGKAVRIQWTMRGIFDRQGRLVEVQSVGRDISDRIRWEQEMLKSQKLESLGMLAGGIAHDFNNVLTSIVGNVTLIRLRLGKDDPLSARLEETEQEIVRAKKLTDQLLTFSKGGDPIKQVQEVTPIVRAIAGSAAADKGIQLSFDIEPGLWMAEVDRGQIGSVINSLMQNAVEAMGGTGQVQVTVKNAVIDEGAAHPPGKYVMISIKDSGSGISPENMTKIFDPYFSTKDRGSGLGLASALSITKRHGGWIEAESKVGQGSRFSVFLPAAFKETTLPAEGNARPRAVRVLLMDDEEAILDVGKELLEMNGFQVETATEGSQAIEMYMRALLAGNKFDVVIMDLTIRGGMGGKEAVRELLMKDPKALAIVSSGYSNDPVMAEYARFGFAGVVKKPYLIKEMVDTILRLVNGSKDRR